MRFRFVSWLSILAILFAIFLTSCSRDPQARKQKYFASGQRYFEKGKYGEAAIEFLNAVKIDPKFAEGHHQLAESYLRLQKPEGAFPELVRTLELQPENYAVRIELGESVRPQPQPFRSSGPDQPPAEAAGEQSGGSCGEFESPGCTRERRWRPHRDANYDRSRPRPLAVLSKPRDLAGQQQSAGRGRSQLA